MRDLFTSDKPAPDTAANGGQDEAFRTKFYALVPHRDIEHMAEEDRNGAALALWRRAQSRQPGTPVLHVYNPGTGTDGWQSRHTVVEVVTDDMPFLVDSVTGALAGRGLEVHLVIHPIIRVRRAGDGMVDELIVDDAGLGPPGPDITLESCMHLQVSRQGSDVLPELEAGLQRVLSDVRAAVEDWKAMCAKLADVTDMVRRTAGEGSDEPDDLQEDAAFLDWLGENSFTFLGYRETDYREGADGQTDIVHAPGLGLLRDPAVEVFRAMHDLGSLPEDVRSFLLKPLRLLVTKANRRSTVHRQVHLDTVNVRKIDADGKVSGVHQFVGLFTSTAYQRSPREIPLLRRKVDDVVARARLRPASHKYKALVNILETFPRDELFQCTTDELFANATGILNIQDRRRPAVFTRMDALERFASCIVFVPRDRYDTRMRERISGLLAGTFNGTIAAYYTQMTESSLARLHVIVNTRRGKVPAVDHERLERQLQEFGRSWADRVRDRALGELGEERTGYLLDRYGDGFPVSYQETSSPETALLDMEMADRAEREGAPQTRLYRPLGARRTIFHMVLVVPGSPIPLSDILPVLENTGLRVLSETPHRISNHETGGLAWLHDFRMEVRDGVERDLEELDVRFREGLASVGTGRLENDGFNQLILAAGFDWREVSVMRAYARYLHQTGSAFSQTYMIETLVENARVARLLIDLFLRRFDPAAEEGREAACEQLAASIDEELNAVANLDQDRILRLFSNLVQSTLRTSFFRSAPEDSGLTIAFKLDSLRISNLPEPRPMVEIWVCSPRVEAIHLRGGRVARGGIRWSDRREDFRTEVLGLMKAQMTKNSVIVPVGSKGGFVVKQPPPGGTREEIQAEGIRCYQSMMRGMLDITDTIAGSGVQPPDDSVRRDGDDPYLVVAADKGTATFSDIANDVAREYGFWLDDAFASGGSAGYDHKGMGITARGAWESVKRHFREIGVDIQNTDFTVVGCGDMSGDVFGNGMLLSRHIRLQGAFNHLHVFVDPDPDPETGWQERKRLFELPRSSWGDYDRDLISRGGGVFDRSAKSIDLTPEIRALFEIEEEAVTPSELIRAMLGASVDLLWFGGIGTYVKSADESHDDAGDRANDEVRVDGRSVRARVIGEGANLGVTQLGRIDYALSGGRINTDAIDNSAGVACSDREVNIKILLGDVMARGDMTLAERDELLVAMTDDVAALVLKDNYDQSQALSMSEARGAELLEAQSRLIHQLERGSLSLDRGIEFLPDDDALAERGAAGGALTRPEAAILLAYVKMELHDELLASDLPDDHALLDDLRAYFPAVLGDRFGEATTGHRLRREIIATYIANSMVNRMGVVFVNEVREQTGDQAPDIARAYIIAREIFAVRELWRSIEELDNQVPASTQTEMLHELRLLVETAAVWLLRALPRPLDLESGIEAYAGHIRALRACLEEVISPFERQAVDTRAQAWEQAGVPQELARAVAAAGPLVRGCDVVRLAAELDKPVELAARVYFSAGSHFTLDKLRAAAEQLPVHSQWDKLAASSLAQDFSTHQIAIARSVITEVGIGDGAGHPGSHTISAWEQTRQRDAARTTRVLDELSSVQEVDLAMLSVASRHFHALIEGTR